MHLDEMDDLVKNKQNNFTDFSSQVAMERQLRYCAHVKSELGNGFSHLVKAETGIRRQCRPSFPRNVYSIQ
eukprot:4180406-Amphidinium_carterae.1